MTIICLAPRKPGISTGPTCLNGTEKDISNWLNLLKYCYFQKRTEQKTIFALLEMSLIYCHDQFIKQHHQEHWQHNDVDLYMSQNKQVCTQRKTNPMYMLYKHLLRLMQIYIYKYKEQTGCSHSGFWFLKSSNALNILKFNFFFFTCLSILLF